MVAKIRTLLEFGCNKVWEQTNFFIFPFLCAESWETSDSSILSQRWIVGWVSYAGDWKITKISGKYLTVY